MINVSVINDPTIGVAAASDTSLTLDVDPVVCGYDGATFTPDVSTEGIISWTNDKGLPNPTSRNIKGPQGEKGEKGDKGDPGDPGTTEWSEITGKPDTYPPSAHTHSEYYIKPATGIPETDLETAVQTSLGKADTAVQPSTLDSYAKVNEAAAKVTLYLEPNTYKLSTHVYDKNWNKIYYSSDIDFPIEDMQAAINTKETADATILKQANVVDNTSSTSTIYPLSANQGKLLNDRLNNVEARGRFLSVWNATTGQPVTQPTSLPYTYKSGDWYTVGEIASGSTTNYKPSGTSYTGAASSVVETEELKTGQVYHFDGTNWVLQPAGGDGKVVDVRAEGVTVLNAGTGIANITRSSLGLGSIATHNDIEFVAVESGKGLSTNDYTTADKTLVSTAIQPNDDITELNNDAGYITRAVDDTSTSSTTLGWSASKLNTTIGNIETLLEALR